MPFNFPIQQNRMGEYLAQGITSAFANAAERRRQKRLDERADQARSDQRTMIEVQNPGLHFTDRGGLDIPSDVFSNIGQDIIRKREQDQAGTPSPVPTRGIPATSDRSDFQSLVSKALDSGAPEGPRYEFGKGYYRDNAEADRASDRAAGRGLQSQFQKTLLDIWRAEQTPRDQQHLVDDKGNVVFFDPRKPPLGLKTQPKAPVPGTPEWREAEIDKATIQRDYGPAPTQFTFGSGLDENGQPVVLRQNVKTGDVTPTEVGRPAAGGGKGSRPTEGQMRANLVFPRAEQAAKDLEEFYRDGAPAKTMIARVPGVGGMVGNYALSQREQRMVQAAETAASAILRLESGAAITDSEVKSYAKQFLPEAGDGPEVRAQKRRALHMQLDTMRGMTTNQAAPVTVPPSATADRVGNTGLKPGEPSHEQKLWDAAVAKHGRDKVIAEFGPRPEK